MRFQGIFAVLITLVAALSLATCSSGEQGVLANPGSATAFFPGGRFLPPVNTVDSGTITLASGTFDGAGENLIFSEPFSTSRIKITDQTSFDGPDQIFDNDADGDYDYLIITQRALSAQAAASVTAFDGATAVTGRTFYKVAGLAILPPRTTASIPVEVTLPVNSAGAPVAAKVYQLYRWTSTYAGPGTATQISAGRWDFVSDVAVDATGNTVTFPVSQFGEYAVVADSITIAASS